MFWNWLELARENRKAANVLLDHGLLRSAVSRAYYAAYSKVTWELCERGIAMPAGRQGPTHSRIHRLVIGSLTTLEKDKREALSRVMKRLYRLRIIADYAPHYNIDARDIREAMTLMNTVFDAF